MRHGKGIDTPTAIAGALTALFVALFLQSCSGPQPADEITVSAAVSLKEAFSEIGKQFEKEHPGTKVIFNFGSSGELCKQIEADAPIDIFASASSDQTTELEQKHLLESAPVTFAKNTLVMVQHPETKVLNFHELKNVHHLAIGNPATVPCGKYAREALEKAGIYKSLESAHCLVLAENVRQVLTYVESGDVDAGFVYATDVPMSHGKTVSYSVPTKYTAPINYPIAIIRSSRHKALAEDFVKLVTSEEGQHILHQRGFST